MRRRVDCHSGTHATLAQLLDGFIPGDDEHIAVCCPQRHLALEPTFHDLRGGNLHQSAPQRSGGCGLDGFDNRGAEGQFDSAAVAGFDLDAAQQDVAARGQGLVTHEPVLVVPQHQIRLPSSILQRDPTHESFCAIAAREGPRAMDVDDFRAQDTYITGRHRRDSQVARDVLACLGAVQPLSSGLVQQVVHATATRCAGKRVPAGKLEIQRTPIWCCMSEASITEVLARYESKGFEGQFSSRPGSTLHCHMCDGDEPAAQAPVLAMHRIEGASDPSDAAVVAAIECPACGGMGTIVLTYGPEAGQDDSAVLAELLDDRDQAPKGL